MREVKQTNFNLCLTLTLTYILSPGKRIFAFTVLVVRLTVWPTKASVRAFVEHPFHIVKNLFRHRKVRYRGLAKNGHQLYTLFGLANVVIGARAVTA